jgi:hypothetical protein
MAALLDTAGPGALTHNLVMYRNGAGQVSSLSAGGATGGGRTGYGFFGESVGGTVSRASVRVYNERELNKCKFLQDCH